MWPRLKAATTVVDGWWEEEHQQEVVRAAMKLTSLRDSAVQEFLGPATGISAEPCSVEAAGATLRESRAVFVVQMWDRVFRTLMADWRLVCKSASSKLTGSTSEDSESGMDDPTLAAVLKSASSKLEDSESGVDDPTLAAVLQVQFRCGVRLLLRVCGYWANVRAV